MLREDPETTLVEPTKAIASKASKPLSHRAQIALLVGGLLMLLFGALLSHPESASRSPRQTKP
jgi:hypothetical protein